MTAKERIRMIALEVQMASVRIAAMCARRKTFLR